MSDQGLLTYVERLQANPDYQALVERIEADVVLKLDQLVFLPPKTPSDQVEHLRGEIRGLMTLLDKPHLYHQQIATRRERAQRNG